MKSKRNGFALNCTIVIDGKPITITGTITPLLKPESAAEPPPVVVPCRRDIELMRRCVEYWRRLPAETVGRGMLTSNFRSVVPELKPIEVGKLFGRFAALNSLSCLGPSCVNLMLVTSGRANSGMRWNLEEIF